MKRQYQHGATPVQETRSPDRPTSHQHRREPLSLPFFPNGLHVDLLQDSVPPQHNPRTRKKIIRERTDTLREIVPTLIMAASFFFDQAMNDTFRCVPISITV